MLPVPAPLAFRPARAVLHDGRQYRSVLSIRQIYLFHCIDSQTLSGKKKGAPDRQNRCALTVAAEAASPPPQQGDQCLTPINVPFGEEDITPFTGEFLASGPRANPKRPVGTNPERPRMGPKDGARKHSPPLPARRIGLASGPSHAVQHHQGQRQEQDGRDADGQPGRPGIDEAQVGEEAVHDVEAHAQRDAEEELQADAAGTNL